MSNTLEEVLIDIFMKCNINGTGVVQKNTLVNCLAAQYLNSQGKGDIKAEIHTLLYADDPTHEITQEHFVNLCQDWFGSCKKETKSNNEYLCSLEPEDTLFSTSESTDVGDYKSTSSTTSTEDNFPPYNYDCQTFSSDVRDDISNTESDSPRSNLKSVLEFEVDSLQRNNYYLENENRALLTQIASYEATVIKNEKIITSQQKKIADTEHRLEILKQKEEECEEKIHVIDEDNKSITIKLSQTERENSKLKELISSMEMKIESVTNEKEHQSYNFSTLKEKFDNLNHLHRNCQEELEDMKTRESQTKEDYCKALEENNNLKLQLESNATLIEELRSEIIFNQKTLCGIQNDNIQKTLPAYYKSDDLSSISSMVECSDSFVFNNSLPLENSLLAELSKEQSEEQDYLYACLKSPCFLPNVSSVSVGTECSTTSDAAINTESSVLKDKETNTYIYCQEKGINCSIKAPDEDVPAENINCKLCYLHFRRDKSAGWWMLLCLMLLLSLLLMLGLTHPRHCSVCLLKLLDLFSVSTRYPDYMKPVH